MIETIISPILQTRNEGLEDSSLPKVAKLIIQSFLTPKPRLPLGPAIAPPGSRDVIPDRNANVCQKGPERPRMRSVEDQSVVYYSKMTVKLVENWATYTRNKGMKNTVKSRSCKKN